MHMFTSLHLYIWVEQAAATAGTKSADIESGGGPSSTTLAAVAPAVVAPAAGGGKKTPMQLKAAAEREEAAAREAQLVTRSEKRAERAAKRKKKDRCCAAPALRIASLQPHDHMSHVAHATCHMLLMHMHMCMQPAHAPAPYQPLQPSASSRWLLP